MSSSPSESGWPSWVSGLVVDAHAHGFEAVNIGASEFGAYLTESSWPAPNGGHHIDTPLGLAVRRWCAPVLDLESHSAIEPYLARRAELGPDEVNRRFVDAAELGAVLVDGGYGESFSTFRSELEDRKVGTREIVRLESCAEELIDSSSAKGFGDDLRDVLDSVGEEVAGFKTVLAYRSGFDIPADPPRRDELVRAVSQWKSRRRAGPARLDDSTIIRHLLWSALEATPSDGRSRRPVQVHVGYGDSDVDLSRTDPLLLTPLVRRIQERDAAPLVLLHGYPFHRQSAYLAAVYPQVYCDIGLSVSHMGASAVTVLAESLEVTPFHKMQFSSDALGLSELYFLGSVLFRRALGTVFGGWVEAGDLAATDAERFADLILRGTARRLYHLDDV